jgi:hypothetical protein
MSLDRKPSGLFRQTRRKNFFTSSAAWKVIIGLGFLLRGVSVARFMSIGCNTHVLHTQQKNKYFTDLYYT